MIERLVIQQNVDVNLFSFESNDQSGPLAHIAWERQQNPPNNQFSTKTSFHKNCNWSICLREVTLSFRFFFNDCHFIYDCKFFNMSQICMASPLQQPRKMPQSSQLVIMQYFTMCSAHTPGVWPICTFYLFWGGSLLDPFADIVLAINVLA